MFNHHLRWSWKFQDFIRFRFVFQLRKSRPEKLFYINFFASINTVNQQNNGLEITEQVFALLHIFKKSSSRIHFTWGRKRVKTIDFVKFISLICWLIHLLYQFKINGHSQTFFNQEDSAFHQSSSTEVLFKGRTFDFKTISKIMSSKCHINFFPPQSKKKKNNIFCFGWILVSDNRQNFWFSLLQS